MEEIKKLYNDNFCKYKQITEKIDFTDSYNLFLEKLNWKKILDAWCAYWRDVKYFYELWYKAFGIDISDKLIERADTKIKNSLTLWDIINLNLYYKKDSFDWLWCNAWIVHMYKEKWIKAIKNFYEVLKSWWILFLATKLRKDKEIIEKNSISIPWVKKRYIYYWKKELEDILKNIWFNIINTKEIHIKWQDSWIKIIANKL